MIEIKLTSDNRLQLCQDASTITFNAELSTEIAHGLAIALAEAGRREKFPPPVKMDTVVLIIPETETPQVKSVSQVDMSAFDEEPL